MVAFVVGFLAAASAHVTRLLFDGTFTARMRCDIVLAASTARMRNGCLVHNHAIATQFPDMLCFCHDSCTAAHFRLCVECVLAAAGDGRTGPYSHVTVAADLVVVVVRPSPAATRHVALSLAEPQFRTPATHLLGCVIRDVTTAVVMLVLFLHCFAATAELCLCAVTFTAAHAIRSDVHTYNP